MEQEEGATPDARRLLGRAVERCGLSARAARRVLEVARTIADLAGEDQTTPRAGAGQVMRVSRRDEHRDSASTIGSSVGCFLMTLAGELFF